MTEVEKIIRSGFIQRSFLNKEVRHNFELTKAER